VVGIDAEEVELPALGRVAGVDDAVVAPGEIALGVEVVGEPARAALGVGQVDDVDVALSVAIEAVVRDPLAVGAEGGIAGLDDAVAEHVDLVIGAEVEIDLAATAESERVAAREAGTISARAALSLCFRCASPAAQIARPASAVAIPALHLGPLQHAVQAAEVQHVGGAALRE